MDLTAVAIYPEDTQGASGAEVTVPFVVQNFSGMSGVQLSLTWDDAVLELINEGDRPKVTGSPTTSSGMAMISSYSFYQYDDNTLTMTWFDMIAPDVGQTLADGDTLFNLHFTLKGSVGDSGVVQIVDSPTNYEITNNQSETVYVDTQVAKVTAIETDVDLSGTILMGGEADRPISGVDVALSSANLDDNTVTDANGQYSFTLTPGGSVSLVASKDETTGISKGVSVTDLVEITKNILSMNPDPLDSPLKVVAADANRDGKVSVTDLVDITKVILSMQSYFSADDNDQPESLWRFVSADFASVSIEDALEEVGNYESINYNTLDGDVSDADFIGIKLGDANMDWTPPTTSTTQGAFEASLSQGLLMLGQPRVEVEGVYVDVYGPTMEGMQGMQYGLRWDSQVLRLEGMSSSHLVGFHEGAHSHIKEGSAAMLWYDGALRTVDVDENLPIMTLHFTQQPGADRGTSIELREPVLVGPEGSQQAAMGVASYYHPEGGTLLSSQGRIRSMHRSEGSLSLEFATQEGRTYVVESTQDLATGQWEAITTIEGSGRHEVIEMLTTEQAQAYLRVREVRGVME